MCVPVHVSVRVRAHVCVKERCAIGPPLRMCADVELKTRSALLLRLFVLIGPLQRGIQRASREKKNGSFNFQYRRIYVDKHQKPQSVVEREREKRSDSVEWQRNKQPPQNKVV